MKCSFLTLAIGGFLFIAACEDSAINPSTDSPLLVDVTSDGQLFDSLAGGQRVDDSDPFVIRKVWRDQTQLLVAVQYSGGCREHEFSIIWDPEIQMVPQGQVGYNLAQLIIIHDGNGDLCEAALTDTLAIDLSQFEGLDQLNVRLVNGSFDQTFSVIDGFMGIPEQETCEYEVVLTEVVCGDGLFGNRWFRFTEEDDPAYLQPAALSALIQLDPDLPVGRYLVGVKITTWTPDPDSAICQAYPGPSVPVDIWCLELIEEGEF